MRLFKADPLTRLLSYLVAVIFVLLPLHAFLTTWLASQTGHFDLARIWKELLLVPISLVALSLAYRDTDLRQKLRRSTLAQLIVLYIALTVTLGLAAFLTGRVNANAFIYALLTNLRFIVFFVVCWVVGGQNDWLKKNWQKLILIPAAIVVLFGLLQHFVLPRNFLTHFGYSAQTIPAYQAVDQKAGYIRTQSTLRGPNPLGAYLVVISTLLVGLFMRDKVRRKWWGVSLLATAIVLFFTYSRSAWVGTFISVAALLYYLVKQSKLRQAMATSLIVGAAVLGGLAVVLRHNNQVQNTLFHTDETSHSSESSNHARSSALISGLKSVIHEPFGGGPGTAGPASWRNNHPPRIAENYYIQIGQEIGLLGAALFIAINLVIGWRLWRARQELLAVCLLTSLVGITLINLLSHAWADDTLSYIWWGLAGIALAVRD